MQVAAPKPKATRRAHPGQGVPVWHASKWPKQRSYVENGERGLGRDHLYSVAALTNSAGAVVERYRYDTFGQRTVLAADGVTNRAASSYNQQIGFTGRYLDKETGLWYFRTRYYSGSLGRFVSRDRWVADIDEPNAGDGYPLGLNTYESDFAPNLLDPWGYFPNVTVAGGIFSGKLTPRSANQAGRPFDLKSDIKFTPKDGLCCNEIAFKQKAKVTFLTGKDKGKVSKDSYPVYEGDPPIPADGWRDDSYADADHWYGYGTSVKGSSNPGPLHNYPTITKPGSSNCIGADGKVIKGVTKPATANDYPKGIIGNTKYEFETCAECKDGNNKGKQYGCILWGFDVDNKGKMTVSDPVAK